MSAPRVWTVAATQLRLMSRDRRLAWLTGLLALVMLASAAVGQSRNAQLQADRRAAAAEAQEVWRSQGPTNPHGAAHFGQDVYAPVSPLAALDPGLSDHLGVAVRLEGHSQNPARERPVEGGAALSRFGGFSAAWALKVLAPLMIILAGFSTFAGERSRELLSQERAAGASSFTLMGGQLLALSTWAFGLVAAFTAAGLALVLANGAAAADMLAALAMGAAFFLYLAVFVGLTLAASASFRTARAALVALLCFWALSTLAAPRLVPALAEQLHPTPAAPVFEKAVTEEAKNGANGHDPADKRLAAFKAETLRHYGVTREEDLPVNFAGLALAFGERNSTQTYNRHYARLFDAYEGQARVQRWVALAAPELAVGPLSMAFARSDLDAHLRFLKQAEAFRYRLIQTLNADVAQHKPPADGPYLADVGALTRHLRFAPRPAALGEVWTRQRANALVLAGWAALAFALAGFAGLRLERPQ
ncbi:DUF3526 domain-containing protein [Phenylobacterium deserti]|uniref:DUF3526 domain-containing protein n=1 Tax=Phenylobacterium deserti TaxID=1914756 RepID=A0A328ABL2_9CAUL|nr:DUF3526 domain-containing protein [Phenylobacterium deserti]RAK52193.1 hypothetical protein DJ018_13670 [Phenylobacterium deserti]